jgi:hypothetical protein
MRWQALFFGDDVCCHSCRRLSVARYMNVGCCLLHVTRACWAEHCLARFENKAQFMQRGGSSLPPLHCAAVMQREHWLGAAGRGGPKPDRYSTQAKQTRTVHDERTIRRHRTEHGTRTAEGSDLSQHVLLVAGVTKVDGDVPNFRQLAEILVVMRCATGVHHTDWMVHVIWVCTHRASSRVCLHAIRRRSHTSAAHLANRSPPRCQGHVAYARLWFQRRSPAPRPFLVRTRISTFFVR